MGEIRWRTSSHGTLLIKPFYNQENGYTMGTGLPGVKPNQIGYWSELTARLQFLNLFNRHYIGLISQNYVQTGASAATFYPGAPLTVVGSLALRF